MVLTNKNIDFVYYIDNIKFINFIINNSSDIFWIVDKNFDLVFISPGIENLTGYKRDEFISMPVEEKYTENTLEVFD